MGSLIPEQALIINYNRRSLFVVTGCGHPSIENIINKASKLYPVHGIIGGFHDFKQLSILKDLEFIIPLHCTKMISQLLEKYPSKAKTLSVGETLII